MGGVSDADARLAYAARIKAAGGTLREAAAALGLTASGLSVFLARQGAPWRGREMPARIDWDAVFATMQPDESGYAIAQRTGSNPSTVKDAARVRGIALRSPQPGESGGQRGIDWTAVLADAVARGLSFNQVAKEQGCAPSSVQDPALRRGIELSRGRSGRKDPRR